MVAGFSYAPVTKGILIAVSIASVLVSLFQLKPFVHLQIYPHLVIHHQWYRLISQYFAFTNSSELFLALLLFYNAGVKVERTFGTFKYASFLVMVTAIYTAAQLVTLALVSLLLARLGWGSESGEGSGSATGSGNAGGVRRSWPANGASPAGPWGPLFAILYQHQHLIPHLWSISVGGLVLTDKDIQVSSLALVVAFSQPPSTLFASALGLLVSWLYRSNARLRGYRLPVWLYRLLSHVLGPWIGQTRLPQRSWRVEPPVRSTREVREARLAEYNAAVANLNRSGTAMGGLGTPRIASLLRRRNQAPQAPPTIRSRAEVTGAGIEAEAEAERRSWNDIPRDVRDALSAFPRTDVMAAVQRSDGNLEEALRHLRTTIRTSGSHGPQQPAM